VLAFAVLAPSALLLLLLAVVFAYDSSRCDIDPVPARPADATQRVEVDVSQQ
jgi:hypothetical protein